MTTKRVGYAMKTDESIFDVERLRRAWALPSGDGHPIGGPVRESGSEPPPLDLAQEIADQLAALRAGCEHDFAAHAQTLDAFLQQIERAATQWSRWHALGHKGAHMEVDPLDAGEQEMTLQAITEGLEQALSGLEDLLEVFLTFKAPEATAG